MANDKNDMKVVLIHWCWNRLNGELDLWIGCFGWFDVRFISSQDMAKHNESPTWFRLTTPKCRFQADHDNWVSGALLLLLIIYCLIPMTISRYGWLDSERPYESDIKLIDPFPTKKDHVDDSKGAATNDKRRNNIEQVSSIYWRLTQRYT